MKRWILSLICLCGLQVASAQADEKEELAQPARGNPAALTGRDAAQGVYVRDSAVAVEKLSLAQRLEHLKEWDKSADVYMEILERYSDRVVPSQVDGNNRIYQYTSVASAVQERLAKWPQAGLDRYRARYEDDAESLLVEAQDNFAKLHRVVSLYFVTESSKKAAMRLIDLYLESADFAAAAWLADRMLTWHPTLGELRPRLLYRAALAHHLSGERSPALLRLEELSQRFPTATALIRGEPTNLAESLEAELKRAPHTASAAPSDSWAMPFGSLDRARVPSASAGFGARLFSVELISSIPRARSNMRAEIERQNKEARRMGQMTGVFPVVDRGELFVQDNARVYAVSLESGTILPGWAETYSGERGGCFSLPAWSTPRGQQCTLTVTDDSVYAVMAQPDFVAVTLINAPAQRGDTRLVCLDRRSGKQKWIATPRLLPGDPAAARNLDFSGSPLVIGDTVYVMTRGGKGMQFEDAYVLALDAADGSLKWSCYLASANTGLLEFGDFSGMFSQRVSHLAYRGGRLYAMTNLGALAAIDANDGTIVWLNLYPRDVPEPNRLMGVAPWNQRRTARGGAAALGRPWSSNPVIVSAGKVFALPSDGLHVLIYDAATGIETTRIALAQFEDAHTMLGVVDEKLLLASDRTVFCINWQMYDEARGVNGNLVWRSLSFSKAQYPDEAIRGRGFLTRDAVIIPTAWALHRISLKTGRHEASYPASGAEWSEGEAPGNVLVLQDRMIVATPERVNVYTDLRLAMSKLDAEVAAAPDAPEPRLRYAEIMSVAGRWDLATQKLDEAMELINRSGTVVSPARDRLFADALSFAQRAARDGSDSSLLAASALFDRAAQAALTAPQQVNYRLTRARVMRGKLPAEVELKLYQQILEDGSMREVPVAFGDANLTRPARVVAERAINHLLARVGRAIYEPYETLAAEKLQSARSQKDAAQLLAIAEQYPNSQAAARALLEASEVYEQAENPRLAAQVLRQLLFKFPDAPDRARIIESLARNYLSMPNRIDVAIARLAQGARLPDARLTRPLKLPDGQVIADVTFTEAIRALRKYNEQIRARLLPDMHLPFVTSASRRENAMIRSFLPETPETVIREVSALVLPLPEFVRHDRVVAYIPSRGLCVFAVGQVQPLFSSDAFSQAPRRVAWFGETLIAWSDAELVILEGAGGRTLWKRSLSSLPQIEVVPAPSGTSEVLDDDRPADHDPRAEAIRLLEIEGRLQPRDVRAAIIRQRMQQAAGAEPAAAVVGPEQILHVRPLSDRIVLATSSGRVVALDLADGRLLWQVRPADRAGSHFLASDDFVVLRLADETLARVQLIVLDASSGQFLSERNFSNADGSGSIPINLALAPDGTLVWITPERLCGKDLFEPGDRLTFEQSGRRDGNPNLFVGAVGPDQLQISEGRIFIVSDDGIYVRVFSLETGKPLQSENADIKLATGSPPNTWNAILRPLGRRLYVVSAKTLFSYDLENLRDNQSTVLASRTALRPRDVILTRSHVVVLSEPAAPGGRPRRPGTPTLQLQAVSRAPVDETGRESGLLDQQFNLSDPSTIVAWQPVEGGLYYLGGDQRLHFLKGAREK